jgi:hypothetical protein
MKYIPITTLLLGKQETLTASGSIKALRKDLFGILHRQLLSYVLS